MLKVYTNLILPVFMFALRIAAFFSPKINEGLKQRLAIDPKPWLKTLPNQRPIIFHCSSGEFEYAKSVLREIKKFNSHIPIFVSYFSPTYQKNIANTPEVDFSFPSPWDDPLTLSEFIKFHNPRLFLIARTDIWPGMVSQLKLHNVPIYLFSSTLSNNSSRLKNPLSRSFTRWLLSYIDKIFCVSDEDLRNIESLGVHGRVSAIGDTRFDQVQFRLSHPKQLKENLRPEDSDFVMVCGSTWPEDENVLIDVMTDLRGRMKFIIAPHEPTPLHLDNLEKMIKRRGLVTTRYSAAKMVSTSQPPHDLKQDSAPISKVLNGNSGFDGDVLIVDQVGILADIYKWGRFAFVGGSFRKTVHSVMEPLATGSLTFVGPLHSNNREALEFKKVRSSVGLPLVFEVRDSREFSGRLFELISRTDLHLQVESIHKHIHEQAGATLRLMEHLHKYLN